MRILIADDHEIVTRGVSSILSTRKDIEVINDARDGQQAVSRARQVTPT
jgi:two-component system NarL family response regulator